MATLQGDERVSFAGLHTRGRRQSAWWGDQQPPLTWAAEALQPPLKTPVSVPSWAEGQTSVPSPREHAVPAGSLAAPSTPRAWLMVWGFALRGAHPVLPAAGGDGDLEG